MVRNSLTFPSRRKFLDLLGFFRLSRLPATLVLRQKFSGTFSWWKGGKEKREKKIEFTSIGNMQELKPVLVSSFNRFMLVASSVQKGKLALSVEIWRFVCSDYMGKVLPCLGCSLIGSSVLGFLWSSWGPIWTNPIKRNSYNWGTREW